MKLISLRRPFWIVLGIFAGSLFGAIVTRSEVYFRLVYISAAVLIVSFLLALVSVRLVSVRRKARVRRKQVGEIFAEQFEIQNGKRFPCLWLEVRDECGMYGKTGSRVLSRIGGKKSRTYMSHSRLSQRGSFSLGPTSLASGDPLGLFQSRVAVSAEDSLIVLPYVVNLRRFPSPAGFLTGGRVIGRRSFALTPQVGGVRDYEPGDPLNRIHWLTTVRKNRLMVKEFEQDPRADVWILLDAQKQVHAKGSEQSEVLEHDPFWKLRNDSVKIVLPPDSFEYGVSIAGSVSNYYINQGKAVGLVSVGQRMIYLAAERGERQQYRMLENLAYIRCEGKMPLLALVEAQIPNLPQGSTIIVITTTDSEKLELALDKILQRRLKPVVLLMDAATFGGLGEAAISAKRIEARGIPVVVVENSADLRNSLENGFRMGHSSIGINRGF